MIKSSCIGSLPLKGLRNGGFPYLKTKASQDKSQLLMMILKQIAHLYYSGARPCIEHNAESTDCRGADCSCYCTTTWCFSSASRSCTKVRKRFFFERPRDNARAAFETVWCRKWLYVSRVKTNGPLESSQATCLEFYLLWSHFSWS